MNSYDIALVGFNDLRVQIGHRQSIAVQWRRHIPITGDKVAVPDTVEVAGEVPEALWCLLGC